MKILLIGEFSALHKYLKEGLIELGHEVVLAADGDKWKDIKGNDVTLMDKYDGKNKFLKLKKYLFSPYKNLSLFKGFDVVQLINPQIYFDFINIDMIKKLKEYNGMIALCAAGADYAHVTAYRHGKLINYMYDYDKTVLRKYDENTIRGKRLIDIEKKTIRLVDIIIPSLYDYIPGYEGNERLYRVIPFPINVDEIDYKENKVKNKIVFFHGLNRELEKGTPFIRKAMEKLKENYPDDVEVIIDGHMPFDDYVKLLNKTNVVIDQCCGYGYGINACISMAQGKVVLTSCRKETLDAFGIDKSPIINIKPDVEQIYKQLEYVVKNKDKITEMGIESRKYIGINHHYKETAQKYIDAWKSVGKI